MIDEQTLALLQEVVRRESRSVLTYVGDAFPWTTARKGEALAVLRQRIDEEKQAVADLGRFLFRHRAPVAALGSYPSSFTTINFLALEYLLPRLIDFERRSAAELERDLAAVHDPQARAHLGRLLAVKQKNLSVLEGLTAARPEAQAAVS